MPTNTNPGTMPVRVKAEAISSGDVETFVQAMAGLAQNLPVKQQALLHLTLAAAAASGQPDVSGFLAGFPIPNPGDVVVAATEASTGSQSDAVIASSAPAIDEDLPEERRAGAAGSALARSLLNNWGEGRSREPARNRGNTNRR
ncbi:MAG: hypothetical protein AB7R89_24945 [Dehalococcoidia bacterium]